MRLSTLLGIALVSTLGAQEPNPTQKPQGVAAHDGPAPIYRVNVTAGTTKAVNYGYESVPTRIDFEGTILLRNSKGKARINSKKGSVQVRATFKGLEPAHRFGGQYLTYVLWAITPEGRATNLGEILTNGSHNGKLETATELQTFALIVTAEPYYAVTQPSDVVVMENVIRADTAGRVQTVDAKYELLQRGEYNFDIAKTEKQELTSGRKVSLREYEALLELYQAQNAVQMAKSQGATEHARGTLDKAEQSLAQAYQHYSQRPKNRVVVTLAREATQMAEDARLIALRKSN